MTVISYLFFFIIVFDATYHFCGRLPIPCNTRHSYAISYHYSSWISPLHRSDCCPVCLGNLPGLAWIRWRRVKSNGDSSSPPPFFSPACLISKSTHIRLQSTLFQLCQTRPALFICSTSALSCFSELVRNQTLVNLKLFFC